jgi:hypothetical protein
MLVAVGTGKRGERPDYAVDVTVIDFGERAFIARLRPDDQVLFVQLIRVGAH